MVPGEHPSEGLAQLPLSPWAAAPPPPLSPLGHVLALDSPGDLLEGSLGLLGVVTEMTLSVTSARKVGIGPSCSAPLLSSPARWG